MTLGVIPDIILTENQLPTYIYEILDDNGAPTGETFESFQSMKEEAYTLCPTTNRPIRRMIMVPRIIMDSKKPKTIGDLADRNTEKMIKSGKIKKKEDETPFWRPGKKVNKKLAKLTQKQKMKYIKTGKIND